MKVCPKNQTEKCSVSESCPVKIEELRSLGGERGEMMRRQDERQNLNKKGEIIREGEEFRGDKSTRGSVRER